MSRDDFGYTAIPIHLARSKDLSLSARGVLFYLMSLPSQRATVQQLYDHFPNGQSDVHPALRELVASGHIRQVGNGLYQVVSDGA